jgi:hypothetical protein
VNMFRTRYFLSHSHLPATHSKSGSNLALTISENSSQTFLATTQVKHR